MRFEWFFLFKLLFFLFWNKIGFKIKVLLESKISRQIITKKKEYYNQALINYAINMIKKKSSFSLSKEGYNKKKIQYKGIKLGWVLL